MSRLLYVLVLLLITPLSSFAEGEQQLEILTIIDNTNSPLKVLLSTDGDLARSFIPYAGLVSNVAAAKRNGRYAKRLKTAIGDYSRRRTIQEKIESFVNKNYPAFKITHADPNENYYSGRLFQYKKVKDYRYALYLKETFSGLAMTERVSTKTDEVVVASGFSWKLYDIKNEKVLQRGLTFKKGQDTLNVLDAINDKAFFEANYPIAIYKNISHTFGELYKGNHLHEMAKSVGRGNEIIPFGDILSPYASRIKFRFTLPDNWREIKLASKFSHGFQIRTKMRKHFGVRYDIDVLIEELGQKVTSVDDYLPAMLNRLEGSGYDISTFKSFNGPELTNDYKTYEIQRPDGVGIEKYFIRKIDSTYLEIFTVVLTDYADGLYNRYENDIASIINNLELTIKPPNEKKVVVEKNKPRKRR